MRLCDRSPLRRLEKTMYQKMNRMAPSWGWTTLMASSTSSNLPLEIPERKVNDSTLNPDGISETNQNVPILHPEDPYLHCIPNALTAIYKPLPILLRMLIGFLTTCFVASRSILLQTSIQIIQQSSVLGFFWLPIRVLRWVIQNYSRVRKDLLLEFLKILIHSLVIYTMATTLLQDLLPRFQPSRISSQDLISKFGTLPSPLSNYATLSPDMNYRVHYLKFKSDGSQKSSVDIVHLNHGFGASSLSWLPVVPLLARTFRTTVVGHDAPGFGLTDRLNDDISHYSTLNSAVIGSTLIQEHFVGASNSSSATVRPTVLLLGHSMGSLTTLRMALQLTKINPSMQLHVVLVAPAVGIRKSTRSRSVSSTPVNNSLVRSIQRPFTRLATSVVCYGLKRLVGQRHFWRNGLRMVWGSSDKLRESDVLRFQWHSIIQGWEAGLFQFALAQGQSFDIYKSDRELLDAVLKEPNVRSIHVIVGSKDPIVRPKRLNKFFKNYAEIPIHIMDGLGHDPFEEDAELFVKTVQSLLPDLTILIDN